ncbi:hypothetical protein [Pseudomonas sessilinigenes]|uniref:Uncharacterized protein n=1 Tax=Pseudomonas sessilinigenes TaxID=658629 RepID=A0ABX8MZ88_9PSED|nr:hypothetical protein [Pseudomonas sessilinigenes]AZC23845.1 hypothetical protein C4K39_2171 [Pseudomonas sessilinigenes]QXH42826.1 hypothetical protein KSS89_11600 [Pseudomonas sessilinigenes]
MEHVIKHLATQGLVLFIFFSLMYHVSNIRRWDVTTQEDFEQALKRLHIDKYQLLVDRRVSPRPKRQGEIYRILHDHAESYFLYQRTGSNPGVLQPLTKERALLAAKMNS